MAKLTFEEYRQFVDSITSDTSKQYTTFLHRLADLEQSDAHIDDNVNIPRLITAAFGMMAEGGEFGDIVKKILFQGKEITPELRDKLIKELGDVAWYWANACTALNVSPNEVIQRNKNKLLERFPGGEFSVERSENRSKNDT
jgi:NTP pyrophosphatase (non-canonical NTP hydrolase)